MKQEEFIGEELTKLLQTGAIKQVPKHKTWCILPVRYMPKQNGKLRLVVDCRHVNNSIKCDKFYKKKKIQQDDELVSVDLKNGFHQVPMEIPKFHKYLAIQWQGRFYVW